MPFVIAMAAVIIIFQFVLLYRTGSSDRLLRAHRYILAYAELGLHERTCHRKRIIGSTYIIGRLIWQEQISFSIYAMYLTVPKPANLHCSMAKFPDDSSPDVFREVPLVWLEYRYRGHRYVSYFHDNQFVTTSYFAFMATTYSNTKVEHAILLQGLSHTSVS